MACMIAIAEAMAMSTTQLTGAIQYRVIQHEDAASWQLESNGERKPCMSWVVVTDNDGKRQLRIQWESRDGDLTFNPDRSCNALLTDQAHTDELYMPA